MNINILMEHNPWWRRPEYILEDSYIVEFSQQKYPFYHIFYTEMPLDKDGILTLRGPRRIGKTTLVKLLIRKLLLSNKVERENVFFFPCDTVKDYQELEEILTLYLDYIRPNTSGRLFIFLDEISFVKEWQRAVKLLSDTGKFKNTLVLITGSNILDLKFSSERLPGRRGEVFPWDIAFLPLDFHQFVKLIDPKILDDPLKFSLPLLPRFRKYLTDYLITGGFPATINEYYKKGFISVQTYEIFLAWIEGDLHKVGKSETSAYQIVKRLFSHLTSPVSFYKLSRESGIASHTTAEDYIDILEKMFILIRLPFFSLDQRQIIFRKNCKIYFADPFIFNCLKAKTEGFSDNPFTYTRNFIKDESNRPLLIENIVSSHLKKKYPSLTYGRSVKDKEIDFVGFTHKQYLYFEVKYQEKVETAQFQWVKNLLGKNRLSVLTKKDYLEGNISLIPADIFLAYH